MLPSGLGRGVIPPCLALIKTHRDRVGFPSGLPTSRLARMVSSNINIPRVPDTKFMSFLCRA